MFVAFLYPQIKISNVLVELLLTGHRLSLALIQEAGALARLHSGFVTLNKSLDFLGVLG